MEKKICENCKFFGKDFDTGHFADIEIGVCRRYAPRILHGSGEGWSNQRYPKTNPDEWCGEYKKIEGDGNGKIE